MTKPASVEVVVILDRSGSMEAIRKDMNGGFDTFISEQKKIPGDCRVTLVQFDTQYEQVYAGRALAEVPGLNLQPRGSTALLDAIGRTINDTGARLKALAEADRPGKVVVLIITDGEENSSREFKLATVREMIERQTKTYSWAFAYLGANQDAIGEAAKFGIAPDMAMNYAASASGTRKAYDCLSSNVASARAGARMSFTDDPDGSSSES